jgi:hypothetical protein
MSVDWRVKNTSQAMRLVALAEESAENDAPFALRCARAAALLTPSDARALVCAAELEARCALPDARAQEVALRLFRRAAEVLAHAATDDSGLRARALQGVISAARELCRPADEARALCELAAVGAAAGWEAVAIRARAAQAAVDAGEISAALAVLHPADGLALPAEGRALLALNEAQLRLAAAADSRVASEADACAVAAQIGSAFERAAAALAASAPSRFAVGVRAQYQALALIAELSAPRAALASAAPLPPLARAGGRRVGEAAGAAAADGSDDVVRRFGVHASGLFASAEVLATAFSTADADAVKSADARARCEWLDARALAAARCGLIDARGLRLGEDVLKLAPASLPTGAAQSPPELLFKVLSHGARAACAAQRCVFSQYLTEATAGCELLTAAAVAGAPARELALVLAPDWHLLLSTGASGARRGAAAAAHAAAALQAVGPASPLEAWVAARADATSVSRRKRPREAAAGAASPAADAHALALSLQRCATDLASAEADAAQEGASAEQRGAGAARLDALAASVRASVAALAAISEREGHSRSGGAWPAAVAFGLCVLSRAQITAAALRGEPAIGEDVKRDADSAYILAHRLKDAQLLVHALASLAAAEPAPGPSRAMLQTKVKMFADCAEVSSQLSAAQWAALDAWRLE